MRSNHGNSSGYTVIELIIVLTILGLLVATTVVNLDGISPKYRLSAGARDVGSSINWTRALAGGTGKTYAMHYDLDRSEYWIIRPPTEEQEPDTPLEDRERLLRLDLPDGVVFQAVLLADGRKVSDGGIDVEIDPLGHEGSHILYLVNTENTLLSIKFSSLLGFVDYSFDELEFEEYQY